MRLLRQGSGFPGGRFLSRSIALGMTVGQVWRTWPKLPRAPWGRDRTGKSRSSNVGLSEGTQVPLFFLLAGSLLWFNIGSMVDVYASH